MVGVGAGLLESPRPQALRVSNQPEGLGNPWLGVMSRQEREGQKSHLPGALPWYITCNLLGVIKEVWALRMRSACVRATSVLSRLCGLGHLGFRFHVYEEEMILPYPAGVSTCTGRLSESLLKS